MLPRSADQHPLRGRGRRGDHRGRRRRRQPAPHQRRGDRRRARRAPCRRRSAGRSAPAPPSRGRPRVPTAWPVARISALLTPRCVAGIRAARQRAEGRADARAGCGTARPRAPAPAPPRRRGAKSVGSPPFSRSTRAPPRASRDQQGVDRRLRRRRLARAACRRNAASAPSRRAQRRRIDQRVVDHRVGRGERRHHLERQAAEAARPGAGQPDVPGLELRQRRRQPGDGRRRARSRPGPPAEPPLVAGVVERALAEPLGGEPAARRR